MRDAALRDAAWVSVIGLANAHHNTPTTAMITATGWMNIRAVSPRVEAVSRAGLFVPDPDPDPGPVAVGVLMTDRPGRSRRGGGASVCR